MLEGYRGLCVSVCLSQPDLFFTKHMIVFLENVSTEKVIYKCNRSLCMCACIDMFILDT